MSLGSKSGVHWIRLKAAADGAGKRAGQHGLGHAGHVFQQDVAAGKIGHDRQDDFIVFAHDDFLDVVHDLIGHGRHRGLHRFPFRRRPDLRAGERCGRGWRPRCCPTRNSGI